MQVSTGILSLNSFVAQVATGISSANHVFLALAPGQAGKVAQPPQPPFRIERCNENCVLGASAADSRALLLQAYGIKVGGLAEWLLEYCGHQLVAGAILAAMMLTGFKLNKAVAWSFVPKTVFILQGILQSRPAKHGTNVVGQYLNLAIGAFV